MSHPYIFRCSKKVNCFFSSSWLICIECGTDQVYVRGLFCVRTSVSLFLSQKAAFPTSVSCLANACLQSPGQPDKECQYRSITYQWALDWPEQWTSSVGVRGIDAAPETLITSKQFLFHIKTSKLLVFPSTGSVVRQSSLPILAPLLNYSFVLVVLWEMGEKKCKT